MARPPEPGEFDWDRPQSGFTVEGEIANIGHLARGSKRKGGAVRIAILVVFAALVLTLLIGAIAAIVSWL
jgi:hypothetical protein